MAKSILKPNHKLKLNSKLCLHTHILVLEELGHGKEGLCGLCLPNGLALSIQKNTVSEERDMLKA